jgi:hypothetical protein
VHRLAGRSARTPALALLLAIALAGCRHKNMPVVFPQIAHAPVELETPLSDSLPMIEPLPEPELGDLPSLPPPARTVPRKKPATKEDAQVPSPAPVASEAETAAVAIGTLSTGGDAAPQAQQQAQDLIASIQKRIAALPAKTADAQRRQIRQVENFLKQAQDALNSGDGEGAKNLANKARLLMDDLEKK